MTALGEKTLILLLTDTDSLEEVARVGINLLIVPSVELRQVVQFAITFHRENGVAPSIEILHDRWTPDMFGKYQINLNDDVEEPIGWALTDLKSTWIQQTIGMFTRKMATTLGAAPPEEQPDVLDGLAAELSAISLSIQPHTTRIDIRESGPMILAEYEYAASSDGVRGLRLGIDEADRHMGGVWPGELAVIAGPSGTGKSFLANWVAYSEWKRGEPTALFTLENSILMTQMRIASFALGLDINALQNGTLPEFQVAMLKEWCNDVLAKSDTPLHILNPETISRSPQAIVQSARAHGCKSVVADQLTHFAAVDPTKTRVKRNEEIADIVRTLAEAIQSGRDPVSCVLMHQITRDGIKSAASTGRVVMTDMAESSEVERSAFAVLCLYQSDEDARAQQMQLQGLKFRRVRPESWMLNWLPWHGQAIDVVPGPDPDMAEMVNSSVPVPA